MKCQLHISILDKDKNNNKELLNNAELKIIETISNKNIDFNKKEREENRVIYYIDLADNFTTGELLTHIYLQYKYIMNLNDQYNKNNIKISIIGLEELPKKLIFKYTFNDKINIIKLSSLFGKEVLTTGFRTASIEQTIDPINNAVYIKSNFIFLLFIVDNWYKQYSDKCLISIE